MLYKKCRVCGEMKEVLQFHKKKGTTDGCRNECKECVKVLQKKYKEAPDFKEKRKNYDKNRYDDNREDVLERKKEYYIENIEVITQKKEEYRNIPENRERNRQYIKNYQVENKDKYYKYRKNNPHCIAWRTILHSTLNRLGKKKEGHTIDLLGYSAAQLKHHIEKQFTEGMSWNNYGEWHLDHIKGVINFDKNTDVKVVCALSNLRPMWATTREVNGIIYEGNLNKPKYE